MKKIFIMLMMLITFSLSALNAQVTDSVKTVSVTTTNVQAYPNDTCTTFIGTDSLYEVGATFTNDTTGELPINQLIDNAYIYSFVDSAIVCNIYAEDSVPAIVILDTVDNRMSISFDASTVDTIADTVITTIYNVNMVYDIQDPTSVENTVAVMSYDMWTENTTVAVTNTEGQIISIYDASGSLVTNKVATSNIEYFTLRSGVYFIKIGQTVLKTVIR